MRRVPAGVEPHLCENPASLSAFSSPPNNRQSAARQGGCRHRGPGVAWPVETRRAQQPTKGVSPTAHPHAAAAEIPCPGELVWNKAQCESIIIKVSKISASVLSLKKTHNLSEVTMTTPLFAETKWPQTLGLRGQPGGEEAGGRPGGGRKRLSALGTLGRAAFHSQQELRKVYSAPLRPSHGAAMFPSG